MKKGFKKLTLAQIERLALLSEELGEAIQAIGKVLRHGYDSSHPDIPERCNRQDLEKELGHVAMAKNLLITNGDISLGSVNLNCSKKAREISQYLHYLHHLDI